MKIENAKNEEKFGTTDGMAKSMLIAIYCLNYHRIELVDARMVVEHVVEQHVEVERKEKGILRERKKYFGIIS